MFMRPDRPTSLMLKYWLNSKARIKTGTISSHGEIDIFLLVALTYLVRKIAGSKLL